jgi:formylglycine-generating enzyme required for sulfatase activity
MRFTVFFLAPLVCFMHVLPLSAEPVAIKGGSFLPFYQARSNDTLVEQQGQGEGERLPKNGSTEENTETEKPIVISSFAIDATPVVNGEFLEFLRKHPAWQKGKVPPALADANYLSHWKASEPYFPEELQQVPVVWVSWFAADAYCASRPGRLPTVNEWEYVAAANEVQKDARKDPAYLQSLLAWYGKSGKEALRTPVRQGKANAWGVYDLHGLIWEWNMDFNSVFLSGDNRREGEALGNMFCGGGSLGASDKANYAAFMRYAMRNSLKGNYTTQHLGFRCVYDS